jgi:hypothetical protein
MPPQTPETPDPTQTGLTPPPGMDVKPSAKERILGVTGAVLNHGRPGFDQTPLGKRIASIHAQRLNEAAMHHQNMATYAGILATGINPQTGQPLTPQERQQYQDWYNAAKAAFIKAGGIDKDTKAAIAKGANVTDAMIAHGQQAQASKQGGIAGGAAGAVSASAPQGPAATAASGIPAIGAGGGGGPTPPPKAQEATPSTSAPYDTQAQIDAPRLQRNMDANFAFEQEKRILQLQHQFKMEEEAAKVQATAQAKAQTPSNARAFEGHPITLNDAKSWELAVGEPMMDQQGEPIDLSKMPDGSMLIPVYLGGGKSYWRLSSQPQVNTTFDNVVHRGGKFDPTGGKEKGDARVGTTSSHQSPGIDPLTGQPGMVVTTSQSTPNTKRKGLTPPPATSSKGMGASPTAASSPEHAPKFFSPSAANQIAQRVAPVREGATQIFGDPSQPGIKSLKDYAYLFDNPEARKRMGEALKMTFDTLDNNSTEGGGIWEYLQTVGGLKNAIASARASAQAESKSNLTPKERDAYDAIMSAYGAVIGLRTLTKSSASNFSAKKLEQELPLPGINSVSQADYLRQLSRLAEYVYNGTRTLTLPLEEKEFYKNQVEELSRLADSGKVPSRKKQTPPPGGASTGPKSTQEILRERGIIP